MTQELRVFKVNGDFKIAYRVSSDIYNDTKIPSDFPNYDPANPNLVFQ